MPGEFPPPYDNLTPEQEDFLRMMREGYTSDPEPGSSYQPDITQTESHPAPGTPLDDKLREAGEL